MWVNRHCLPRHPDPKPVPPSKTEEPKEIHDPDVSKPEPEVPEPEPGADVPAEPMAIVDIRRVTEEPPMLSNLAFANMIANNNLLQQNAISKQQAMNQLGLTVTGQAINRVSNLSS